MYYLYFGKEPYQLMDFKKKLLDQAQKKNIEIIKPEIQNFETNNQFCDFFNSGGLFSQKKLIVFDDFLSNALKEKKQNLLEIFKKQKNLKNSQDEFIYFFEKNPDKRSSLFKFLKRNSKESKEFKELSGAELENFILNQAKMLGIKISKIEISRICAALGNNIFKIINELKKIDAYKRGMPITLQDIKENVEFDLLNDIFKTIDSLAQGDKKTALRLIKNHLKTGDNEFYILSMIVYQFRNLLQIKDAQKYYSNPDQIAKETQIHPFVINKARSFISRFSDKKLKTLYQKLAQLDYSVKKGAMDINTALDLFICFS
ncbi:MAG: DNA polymerase III subunit delta [Candidatus Moranbacteria bacterium]|nr:DNA polymerase III subunit delta [Candidatus Moranbacteria bacterium]